MLTVKIKVIDRVVRVSVVVVDSIFDWVYLEKPAQGCDVLPGSHFDGRDGASVFIRFSVFTHPALIGTARGGVEDRIIGGEGADVSGGEGHGLPEGVVFPEKCTAGAA